MTWREDLAYLDARGDRILADGGVPVHEEEKMWASELLSLLERAAPTVCLLEDGGLCLEFESQGSYFVMDLRPGKPIDCGLCVGFDQWRQPDE